MALQRSSRVSLKDRQPTVIFTDSDGRFRLGPVDPGTYDVRIAAEGFTFSRIESTHDFIATRIPKLYIRVIDNNSVAIREAVVEVTNLGLLAHTDAEGVASFGFGVENVEFLQVSMVEYSFNGDRTLRERDDGFQEVLFVGTRTAYSAYGTVRCSLPLDS